MRKVWANSEYASAKQSIIDAITMSSALLPAQALGELFHVLVRKARRTPTEARKALRIWQDACIVIPTTEVVLTPAMGLAADTAWLSGTRSSSPPHRKPAAAPSCPRTCTKVSPGAASPSSTHSRHHCTSCWTISAPDAGTGYVTTSAPCASSSEISRVCSTRKSITTRVRGARCRRDG